MDVNFSFGVIVVFFIILRYRYLKFSGLLKVLMIVHD